MNYISKLINDGNIKSKKLRGLEFYKEDSINYEVDIEFGELRSSNRDLDSGIAIRTIDNEDHLGFSFSTDINSNSIEHLIDQSIAFSRISEKIPENYGFTDNSGHYQDIQGICDKNISNLDENDLASQIEGLIKEINDEKINFDKLMLSAKFKKRHLINSDGLDYNYKDTFIQMQFMLSSSGIFSQRMFGYREYDLEKIKKDVACVAGTLKLHNKLPKTRIEPGKKMIIFHPYALACVLRCLLPGAINAEVIYNKNSYFNIDQMFTENNIMLIDDGSLNGGLFSSSIDAEGFPTKKTSIIDKGIFIRPISNNLWATIDNFENTSNSYRKNFRSPPYLNITNLIFDIENNKADMNEIFSLDHSGIYISNLIPNQAKINTRTGDYLFNVIEACYVKNGEIRSFLKPFLLFGNVRDLFSNINLCSKESFTNLGVTCPYINVSEMKATPMPEIPKKELIITVLNKIYNSISNYIS